MIKTGMYKRTTSVYQQRASRVVAKEMGGFRDPVKVIMVEASNLLVEII